MRINTPDFLGKNALEPAPMLAFLRVPLFPLYCL
jgi:hypothetical protein